MGNLQKLKNELEEAEKSYKEALKIYRDLSANHPQSYLPDLALTLNNFGNLQVHKNELEKREQSYTEALKIYRDLSVIHPQSYFPQVARTAVNLSIFYLKSIPDQVLSLAYAKEAILSALSFIDILPLAKKYMSMAIQIIEAWGLDAEKFIQDMLNEKK